ncbi:glutathione S-transferase family protein [Cupriavidus sp. IDO]|uniref:glutathione S-transferase family protein n=1 Tax=Cupriavidus sp. IDO TaxID=1539142 RepID=UPI000578EA8B|nr:glutathione S-transferase family protein [Cupriavidus sp. IDO]KWR87856.1 glutathione S-transferase [Cupriavidus sp. IDO]
MITLYHCNDARSFRCLWLLEEMKLPYEAKIMDFPPRIHAPEYLRVNATGSVPCLQDGATTLNESAAILEYLATRYPSGGLAVARDDADYGQWLNWLHFGEASLTTPLATLMRYAYFEPPERRQPAVVADYREFFFNRLALVESALQQHDYLVADRFTAADISVGYALLLSRLVGLQPHLPPPVLSYWARLQERPAFKAAKQVQKAWSSRQAEAASA